MQLVSGRVVVPKSQRRADLVPSVEVNGSDDHCRSNLNRRGRLECSIIQHLHNRSIKYERDRDRERGRERESKRENYLGGRPVDQLVAVDRTHGECLAQGPETKVLFGLLLRRTRRENVKTGRLQSEINQNQTLFHGLLPPLIRLSFRNSVCNVCSSDLISQPYIRERGKQNLRPTWYILIKWSTFLLLTSKPITLRI